MDIRILSHKMAGGRLVIARQFLGALKSKMRLGHQDN